jgi:hypothetical protein
MSTTPAANLPPVSTTMVANLPPVSTTPAGATGTAGVVDTGGKIMDTISDYWHLKVNLKEKIYLYVNSTTQRCSKKELKLFWLKIFSFVTGVNDTGGAPWAANISANFRKNSKRPEWYTNGLGGKKLIKKTWSGKSRGAVPLK